MVLTAGLLILTIGFAYADPIEERQALMKDMGRAVGSVAKIAQGQEPFDAAKVQAALETLAADAQKLDVEALFPEGTETGGDTEASPKIWEDRAGFIAVAEKFKADTAAAVAANPQDLQSFQTQFKLVTANCGTCHQGYRVKR
ncbi:MAG TPA: cytochrome c [Tianweitania sediminis]|nr:cytochrome c [Tianweitania sediminis]